MGCRETDRRVRPPGCPRRERAPAQVLSQDFYVANGTVSATALSGTTLYIGGQFTTVGPASGVGNRWRSEASLWPERQPYTHLSDLLDPDGLMPLSYRAALMTTSAR